MQTASNEKSVVFVVVNKFDNIMNKSKCKREILAQISSITPSTFTEHEELVHFVSARKIFPQASIEDATNSKLKETDDWDVSFERLEESLRSFVLEKRSRSKLAPAHRYLQNILSDLSAIANHQFSKHSYAANQLDFQMQQLLPVLDDMKSAKLCQIDSLDILIESAGNEISNYVRLELTAYVDDLDALLDCVEWKGILFSWVYCQQLVEVGYQISNSRISTCKQFALEKTRDCISEVETSISHLPESISAIDQPLDFSAFDRLYFSNNLTDWKMSLFFTSSDIVQFFGDFVTSATLVAAGLVGFQGWSILNIAPTVINISRMPWTLLMAGGILFLTQELASCVTSLRT